MTTSELKQKLVVPISFDEKSHVYDFQGQLFTGVTTILNVLNKPFLVPWAAKMVAEDLKPKWEEVKKITKKADWDKLVDASKGASTRKADKAKDIGHQVHAWIEGYITNQELELPEDQQVVDCIRQFLKWNKERKPEWLASEAIVASMNHRFAGTVDALCILDGKMTVLDFKTSNQISDDYALQLAGYQIALEEMGIQIEQRSIVRIPKDGKPVEEWIVDTPLDFDKETFLRCREIHRWNLLMDSRKKDKKQWK